MRRAAVTAALVVLLPLAPACSTKTPSPPPTESLPAVHGSFAECLRGHGLEATGPISPAGAPAGVDPVVWEQAMQACSTLAPGPAGP